MPTSRTFSANGIELFLLEQGEGPLVLLLPNLPQKLIIEGAGHWIQQERPDEVNAALIDFVRECVSRAGEAQ